MGWKTEEKTPVEVGLKKRSLTELCCRRAGQKLPPGHYEKGLSPRVAGTVLWNYLIQCQTSCFRVRGLFDCLIVRTTLWLWPKGLLLLGSYSQIVLVPRVSQTTRKTSLWHGSIYLKESRLAMVPLAKSNMLFNCCHTAEYSWVQHWVQPFLILKKQMLAGLYIKKVVYVIL